MIIANKFNGYGADGRRLYFKGGSSSKSAERMERERQARVQAAVDAINNIFDPTPYTSVDKNSVVTDGYDPSQNPNSRETLYNEQEQAVYDLNAKEVNDQYADAERTNRFALARNGLLGGSSDVESNANLQEKTNEGLIQARALGQQAASDLRTADEQSKQSLIAMAQSGIDTGTAQQMAAAQLNANAQSALGQRGGATIGNLFDNLSQAYLARQIINATQNGYNLYNNNYGNLSTSSRGDQGSVR